MFTFGPKINRCYNLYTPFMKKYYNVAVYFHKANTLIGFKPDAKLQDLSKDNEINLTIYKDLKQSLFADTFLDIKDFRSDTLDIRSQFSNIKENFKEKIQYIANESVKLSKVQTDGGVFENLIFVYGFTFTDYQNDFVYFLVERQHIDTVLNRKIVRTSSIQISTPDCHDTMMKLAEHYRDENIDNFENKRKGYDTQESLGELFPEKSAKAQRI